LTRLKNIELADFNRYEVALLKEKLALLLSGERGNKLMIFDDRLQEEKSLSLQYSWLSITALDNEIYVTSQINPIVHVYDYELSEIRCFGQSTSPDDELYFKPNAEMFFSDYTIFQVNENSVNVLDKTDLRVLRSFEFDSSKCLLQINADSTYYLLKLTEKSIDLCDFEGNVIESTHLKHVHVITSFFVDDDGYLVLIADNKLVYYSRQIKLNDF
jgi:hypothetical protein